MQAVANSLEKWVQRHAGLKVGPAQRLHPGEPPRKKELKIIDLLPDYMKMKGEAIATIVLKYNGLHAP